MSNSTIKTVSSSQFLKKLGTPLPRLENEGKIANFMAGILDQMPLTGRMFNSTCLGITKNDNVTTSEQAIRILRNGGDLTSERGGYVFHYKRDNDDKGPTGLYVQPIGYHMDGDGEESLIDVTA